MHLNQVLNTVERHWQVDSTWNDDLPTQPIEERIAGLHRFGAQAEIEKKKYALASIVTGTLSFGSIGAAVMSPGLLALIPVVCSIVLGIIALDVFQAYFGWKSIYNVVEEFADTLERGPSELEGNTWMIQRYKWSFKISNAKWLFNNLTFFPNPLRIDYANPGLELLPRRVPREA